jgi:hypothetical protein
MAPLLPPPSMRRRSAQSRAFLAAAPKRRPGGAPPGQCLRSGVAWQLSKKRDGTICQIKVSTLSGETRPCGRGVERRLRSVGNCVSGSRVRAPITPICAFASSVNHYSAAIPKRQIGACPWVLASVGRISEPASAAENRIGRTERAWAVLVASSRGW